MRRFLSSLLAFAGAFISLAHAQSSDVDTLRMRQAVEAALANHPSIRSAEAGLLAAEAGHKQAFASYFPNIAFTASATHTEGVFVFNPSIPSRNQIYSSYTGALQAQQIIFDFGKTIGRVSAATDFTEAARGDYTAARDFVALNVQIAYLGLLAAMQVVAVDSETVDQAAKHLTQARAFYSVGRRPQFDVTKAEVDLANARVNLIKSSNATQLARVQLENAMGIRPARAYAVTVPSEYLGYAGTLDSARSQALQRRPELLAARSRVEANRALARAAASQHWPTLSAVGTWSWNSFKPSPLYPRWSAGLQFSLPIFQGFGVDAQVEQADANTDIARAALDTQTQNVLLEVDQAYLNLREAEERRIATAKLVEQADQNFTLADRQYAAGVGTPIEVADAQVTRSNARITDIQALYDYITSLVRLRRAIGHSGEQLGD